MNTEQTYTQPTAEQLHKYKVTRQLKQQIKELSQRSREVKRERKSTLPDSERKHFLTTDEANRYAAPHYRAQIESRKLKADLSTKYLVYAYLRGRDLTAVDKNWADTHSLSFIASQAGILLDV